MIKEETFCPNLFCRFTDVYVIFVILKWFGFQNINSFDYFWDILDHKTCILYFTLSPTVEANRKRWTKSSKVNLKIAQKLYTHTLRKIQSTQLPYVVMTEQEQSQLNFGDNITEAIRTIFQKGFEHVIVLGNDCPNVSVQDIQSAYANIQSGEHTLGLTKEGGSYLFTISKDTWADGTFNILPWCTAQLGETLYALLENQAVVNCLKTKADINFLKDIHHLITNTRSLLTRFFKAILYHPTSILYVCLYKIQYENLSISGRGPPSLQ